MSILEKLSNLDAFLLIDFLKIEVTNSEVIESFKKDDRLVFCSYSRWITRNQNSTKESGCLRYHGIDFKFIGQKLDIYFRPHYLYNDYKHNANDFSVDSCRDIIRWFEDTFGIYDHRLFRITNIEYGVNFRFPKYGKDLISMLGYSSKNEFTTDKEYTYSKRSSSTDGMGVSNKYKIVKFYSKGIQYPSFCEPDVLRFEIKSKKSARIRKLGIEHIGDLLDVDCYKNMRDDIVKELGKLLILDYRIDRSCLPIRDRNKLNKYLSNATWFEVSQKSRNRFNEMKDRYNSLLDKLGFNVHNDLIRIVSSKLDIICPQCENSAYFPPPHRESKSVLIFLC